MSDMEHMRWVLDRQLGWIASADAKLAILVPLPLAMITFTLIEAGSSLRELSTADFPTLAGIVLLSLSLLFAVATLIPRTKGPSKSNIFFGLIASRSVDEFQRDINSNDSISIEEDLARQIYVNAQIADSKHLNVTRSIICLTLAIPFWIVSVAKVGLDGVV